MLICTKFTSVRLQYVLISVSDFSPNRIINGKIADRNSFTLINKVWISLSQFKNFAAAQCTMWRSQICHTSSKSVLKYGNQGSKLIQAYQQIMASTGPSFKKVAVTQWIFVENSLNEFHSNRTKNIENKGKIFKPVNELSQFSRNSHLLDKFKK